VTLIGIIGEPATGKTAVMRAVLERLPGHPTRFKFGLLRGRSYRNDLYVLGIYRDGELFAGTDRLSMAVQPYAVKFLKVIKPGSIVMFEGDRLTREGFLMAVPYDALRLFLLVASEAEKARRHVARHDTQPEQFHRSRRTLIERMRARFAPTELVNEKPAHVAAIAARICAIIPGAR
jgi:hypothetical protein